jgi:HPt (histidine-containing phosphotransfer) domain-containing protein
MMQLNADEFKKSKYLCVADAVQRVGDDELVCEMLGMLNSSIEKDWSDFEAYLNTEQFILAANILHGMKGTVPIFSDKKTGEVMQKTESLLRDAIDGLELKSAIEELRCQTLGFMAELKLWVKQQNQSP